MVGDWVLVDDGKVVLVVDVVEGDDVVCIVVEGGLVSDNKGILLFGMNVIVLVLLEKDIEDFMFVLNFGVDMVVFFFVCFLVDVELVYEVMDWIG